MPIEVGTHRLGPENGTFSIRTGRTGGAAKAGHDLLIQVTSWKATLEIATDPSRSSLELDADPTSLRVCEGTGGIRALGDEDKANIQQRIANDILKRERIAFRSAELRASADGTRLGATGELALRGETRPIAFDLDIGENGRLSAAATVKQTDWGIKPYSALLGALRVADDVEVSVEVSLPSS